MKTIEILVTPTGQTTVETKGFAGAECRDAGRFIERALGKTSKERLTAEFYQQQQQEQPQQHEQQ